MTMRAERTTDAICGNTKGTWAGTARHLVNRERPCASCPSLPRRHNVIFLTGQIVVFAAATFLLVNAWVAPILVGALCALCITPIAWHWVDGEGERDYAYRELPSAMGLSVLLLLGMLLCGVLPGTLAGDGTYVGKSFVALIWYLLSAFVLVSITLIGTFLYTVFSPWMGGKPHERRRS